MRLLVCAVARASATRTGYHAYTRARTDDNYYARRNPFYYTSSWVVPVLKPTHRHQAPASRPGDPAGTLEQDSEESINSDGWLVPHIYYDVSFAPRPSEIDTIRLERNRGGGAGSAILIVVEAIYPPIAFSACFPNGIQLSRLPDLRNVREMMDGWEQWTRRCIASSHTAPVS